MLGFVPQPNLQDQRSHWEKFENYVQDFVKQGKEVYVVTGIDKIKDSLSVGNLPDTKDIQIPQHLWKVILVLDHPNADVTNSPVYAVGFYTNNEAPGDTAKNWRSKDWNNIEKEQRFVWSLQEIEEATGYELFPNLPLEIKQGIEDIKYIFRTEKSIGQLWNQQPWETQLPSSGEDPVDSEESEDLEGDDLSSLLMAEEAVGSKSEELLALKNNAYFSQLPTTIISNTPIWHDSVAQDSTLQSTFTQVLSPHFSQTMRSQSI